MSSPSPHVSSLLKVATPLILAGLSANLSIFVDRTILSHYSVDMMSQVTTVMNYCWAIFFATTGVTWISKVFVGQFNGAKEYHRASEITWQMIFFSIACQLLFTLAYFAAPWIVPPLAHEHGLVYFQILMLFGFTWPISSSLSSFFIGTYQNKTFFSVLMIANIINIGLDLLWIPTHGTYGAAMATVASMVFQNLCLLGFFLTGNNSRQYNTWRIKFNLPLIKRAILLGYPESLSHSCEMLAWATVLSIISTKGDDYMTVSALAQNLFILFMFMYSEVGNAVKAMAANYIGQDQRSHIPVLLQSAMILHTSFMLIIGLSLYFHPEWFIALFSLSSQTLALQNSIIYSLQGVLLFMFLDGIAYILASLLSAYGDTFASMMITATNMWLFLVLPTYILINFYPTVESTHSLTVLPLYGIIIAASYAFRHQQVKEGELSVINL